MAIDPEILAHKHWLGYVQPVGLVVSIPALLNAQAYVNKNVIPDHQRFLSAVDTTAESPTIKDFPSFVRDVFEWQADDLLTEIPASLEVPLPEYGEVLAPTYVLKEFKPAEGKSPWILLVKELPVGQSFDDIVTTDDRHWQASPHARFERLLRETQVPIGLLVNGHAIRVVYAPRGENSGYATFRIADMVQVSGRPIFSALLMLLSADRLFTLGDKQRLPAILEASRKYQSLVSTKLSEQVLAALYELLRGFQAADEARRGELLSEVLKNDPNHVYNGLLTVLMRLVFVLYAEDRGLLSSDPLYSNHYSVTGLFERLRTDAGRHPDTMDQRYGGWSQLLTLFRLIFDGAPELKLPARQGYLFDPDRYNFLEGRPWKQRRTPGEKLHVPRLSDGVIFRVLSNLLILDGERLSYRTLDVEQIGSVYETMMGFNVQVAEGRSIAIKPAKSHGAPAAINLEGLLGVKPSDRAKWLKENADQSLTGAALDGLKSASTVEDLLAALEKKIAKNATPNVVSKGSMVLQPSDERRKSGSHYTPRSLTEPIVRKTLEPILKRLGDHPTPQQLLDLKVCDPAMGSGAFLVEVCRQLGDELVRAWHYHKQLPRIPADEDEILHARRVIAQRCLYGVDRNPMAVDLAKLSLWLATLAKDHPFTFLDHTLRHGDSLVGLTRQQIEAFHWLPTNERQFGQEHIARRIEEATRYRKEILDAGDNILPAIKSQKLAVADDLLNGVRFFGDLVIAAYFSADKDRTRKEQRDELLARVTNFHSTGDMAARPKEADQLRSGKHPVWPFHWEIEFPEVFVGDRRGFDAIVGNPPFVGGTKVSAMLGKNYLAYLLSQTPGGSGNADLAAHFLGRFTKIGGTAACLGVITTSSVQKAEARTVGLSLLSRGGFELDPVATREWPSSAATVMFVVVHGRRVQNLRLATDDQSPLKLKQNEGQVSRGCDVVGSGFVLSAEEFAEWQQHHSESLPVIRPFLGGTDFTESPTLEHSRYIIDFGEMSELQARQYSTAFARVERLVKPARATVTQRDRREMWWLYVTRSPELRSYFRSHDRCIATAQLQKNFAFAFVPNGITFPHTVVLFLFNTYAAFASLQSRLHTTWIARWGGTMGRAPRYTTRTCFDTFPFPEGFEEDPLLEAVGQRYDEWRSDVMLRTNKGLTETYNRFHDPDVQSADIVKLRELHAAMDRAVLDAYGWTDIPTDCQFLLDYEEDEDDDTDTQLSPKRGKAKKKPWRYRWPDEVRDEVLARLLALNAERAAAEKQTETSASKPKRAKRKSAKPEDANHLWAGAADE